MSDAANFPQALPSDPEDVSWALSTGQAMWSRGEQAEAIRWIKRASDSAADAGDDDRALTLARVAADLRSRLGSAPPPPPPDAPRPPPPPVDAPRPPAPPADAPRPPPPPTDAPRAVAASRPPPPPADAPRAPAPPADAPRAPAPPADGPRPDIARSLPSRTTTSPFGSPVAPAPMRPTAGGARASSFPPPNTAPKNPAASPTAGGFPAPTAGSPAPTAGGFRPRGPGAPGAPTPGAPTPGAPSAGGSLLAGPSAGRPLTPSASRPVPAAGRPAAVPAAPVAMSSPAAPPMAVTPPETSITDTNFQAPATTDPDDWPTQAFDGDEDDADGVPPQLMDEVNATTAVVAASSPARFYNPSTATTPAHTSASHSAAAHVSAPAAPAPSAPAASPSASAPSALASGVTSGALASLRVWIVPATSGRGHTVVAATHDRPDGALEAVLVGSSTDLSRLEG